MGQLLKGELKKLLHWKILWMLLLLLMALNCAVLSWKIQVDVQPQTEGEWSSLPQAQQTEAEGQQDYEEFLDKVEIQAEAMKGTEAFGGSRFGQKSLERTKKIYARLHGIEPEQNYPDGLQYVTDYRITDFFLLLAVMALLMQLLIYERAEGLMGLLKPAANGREKLISVKMMVLVFFSAVLTAAFYGTNYILAAAMGLLGDGSAVIQSLEGYLASPFSISVNEYLVLFLLCKWIGLVAVGCVFFLICILCRSMIYSVLVFVGAAIGECTLWLSIEDHSWLSLLRQFNLARILDTSAYFNDYVNINFFGWPLTATAAGALTVILAVVLSGVLAVEFFSREASVEVRKSSLTRYIKLPKFRMKASASLLRGEFRKLFFIQRGLLLLVLLLVVQFFTYQGEPFFMDEEEAFYQRYSAVLEGELSEEKKVWLQKEQERFDEQYQKLEIQYDRFEKGEIGQAILDYYISDLTPKQAEINGFEKARNQYAYLQQCAEDGNKVLYVYQTGWERLLGRQGQRAEIIDFAKMFVILILALSGLGSIERQTHTDMLINASAVGTRRADRFKAVLCSIFALSAAGITFPFRPLQLHQYYGLFGLNGSLNSLLMFADGPFSGLHIPIGAFLAVCFLLKAFIAVCVGQLIFFFSRKFGRDTSALLLSSIILLTPLIILLLHTG